MRTMNTSELADGLFELTASWQPTGAATQQDLRQARLYLADGFLSGIAPQQSQWAPAFRTSVGGVYSFRD